MKAARGGKKPTKGDRLLTPALRRRLKRPLGRLFPAVDVRGEEFLGLAAQAKFVVTVGDRVTETLQETMGRSPDVFVVDGLERRAVREVPQIAHASTLKAKNPAGRITGASLTVMKKAFAGLKPAMVLIDGEDGPPHDPRGDRGPDRGRGLLWAASRGGGGRRGQREVQGARARDPPADVCLISGLSLVVNVALYLVAISITLFSGYLTFRQRLTSYQLIRDFLVEVYIVILFLMLADLARILTGSPALLYVYPLLPFGLGFLESILLFLAAVGTYLRPNGSTYSLLLSDLRSRPKHFVMFLIFVLGTSSAEAYLAFVRPFSTITAQDFAGGTVLAASYSTTFAISVGLLFVLFLVYPVGLLAVSARKVQNPQMRRAQYGLAIGWAGSSAIYLMSAVSLYNFAIDLTAIAYVILSVFFGLIARNFRNAAIYSGFVNPATPTASGAGEAWRLRPAPLTET